MSTALPPGRGSQIAARYEAWWSLFAISVILLILAFIVFTGTHWSAMPPSRLEVLDPRTVHRSGEFVEENLGTAVEADGAVTVRVLAEQYAFRPHCLVLPQGEAVTLRSTSADVVHGLQIMGTNANTMIVPGYVTSFVVTLNDAGEHSMPCHEFCGVGHASMWAHVKVLPKADFDRLALPGRRLSCD